MDAPITCAINSSDCHYSDKYLRRGWCRHHYDNWRRYGDPLAHPPILEMHGMERTPEYRSWATMKTRCLNPRSDNYHLYGAKGITVCKEWIESFTSFYEHIGPKPEPKSDYSVDRIDTRGNYEPGNVRWATRKEQALNKINRIDHELVRDIHKNDPSLRQWQIAEILGCSQGSVSRILGHKYD